MRLLWCYVPYCALYGLQSLSIDSANGEKELNPYLVSDSAKRLWLARKGPQWTRAEVPLHMIHAIINTNAGLSAPHTRTQSVEPGNTLSILRSARTRGTKEFDRVWINCRWDNQSMYAGERRTWIKRWEQKRQKHKL
jgi:hypothetical protein